MKVLIVEDEESIARVLARSLRQRGYVTDICANGADAVRQAGAIAYEAILLDWVLPDIDGLSVCRAIRRAGSTAPILMLTGRGELSERVLGLEAGADDYLIKPFAIDELVARLRAVMRRTQGFGRLAFGPLEIDRLQRQVTLKERLLELTSREYALLLFLAGQPDQPVSRADIFAHVWASSADPGSNLVDVHISRLRDKFGDLAWMIDTVRGKGYRLRTSAER